MSTEYATRAGAGNVTSNERPAPSVAGQTADLKDSVADALQWGKSGISDSAAAAQQSLSEDMERLRADLAGIRDTLSKFMSETGGEAAKTVKKVGEAVASHVGSAASSVAEAGADMASSAKEQVKTFATELEGMAKRQPLGSLAGALVVGVLIGIISRGRN